MTLPAIRTERQRLGMSQKQLAKAAKVSQPTISAIERGQREPSAEVRHRVYAVLGYGVEVVAIRRKV